MDEKTINKEFALDVVSEKMGLTDRDETWSKLIKPCFRTLKTTGPLQKQLLDTKMTKKIVKT